MPWVGRREGGKEGEGTYSERHVVHLSECAIGVLKERLRSRGFLLDGRMVGRHQSSESG